MNEEGYTLVELLVAIAILGIIMLTFSNFILNYQQKLFLLENKVVANNLARLKLEEFRDSGLNNQVVGQKNHFKAERFSDYSYTLEKRDSKASLKKIEIRIYHFENELFRLVTFL